MPHILMRHDITGGVAEIPAAAVPHMLSKGWRPANENVPDSGPDKPAPAPETEEQEPATPADPEHEE